MKCNWREAFSGEPWHPRSECRPRYRRLHHSTSLYIHILGQRLRAAETPAQRNTHLDTEAIRRQRLRAAETPVQRDTRLDTEAVRRQRLRAAETRAYRETRLDQDALSHQQRRIADK